MSRTLRTTVLLLVVALCGGLSVTFGPTAPVRADAGVTEFPVPGASGPLDSIVTGPDGNLWFREGTTRIGKVTPAGVVTEYPVPAITSTRFAEYSTVLVAGPDGNLWFTEQTVNTIGRITPDGAVTEFALPQAKSFPTAITAGPDGNLWFTEQNQKRIGRITPAGDTTEYPLDGSAGGITTGPDGRLWFAYYKLPYYGSSSTVGPTSVIAMSPSGDRTEIDLTLQSNGKSYSVSINGQLIAGPDGNFWTTLQYDSSHKLSASVVRFTPQGDATYFGVPGTSPYDNASREIYGMAAGPDGNVWVAVGQLVGRITPAGKSVLAVRLPVSMSATAVTAGPDGNLWVAGASLDASYKPTGAKLWRVAPTVIYTPPPPTAGVTDFPLPDGTMQAYGLTTGPDGNLWFTIDNGGASKRAIARMTPAGAIATFPFPYGSPLLTPGADGNVWFTANDADGGNAALVIGKITPDGAIASYSVRPDRGNSAVRPARGSDGNVWFIDPKGKSVGKVTPGGVVTEYPMRSTPSSTPLGLTLGTDGALWFAEDTLPPMLARITPDGAITETAIVGSFPAYVALSTGLDGNFYAVYSYAERGLSTTKIVRLTPAGAATTLVDQQYSEEGALSAPAIGPDGAFWFAQGATGAYGGRIVRMTTDGAITARYQLPDDPHELVFGTDGNLWFTQTVGREPGVRISRLQLSLAVPLPGATATGAAPAAASGPSPPAAPAGQPQPASDR